MNVLVALVYIIHVVASAALVILILLHSGKGTGVSSMFSGVMPASATGTSIVEKNLDRFTLVSAATFTVTTLLLMVVTG